MGQAKRSGTSLSCSHAPGSVSSFKLLGGGVSPSPTPPSMLFAHSHPPCSGLHHPIRTGSWALGSPKPGREGPGTVPRGWSPGPSLQPPGSAGQLQTGVTTGCLELRKCRPPALPSPCAKLHLPLKSPCKWPLSQEAFQDHPSSASPPERSVYSASVFSPDPGLRSLVCLFPDLSRSQWWEEAGKSPTHLSWDRHPPPSFGPQRVSSPLSSH